MRVIGFAGYSGSGKTTLVERLIPALIARGRTVSTVKHAHHAFDLDQPGKDSYRHRAAGAYEVLVSSGRRWALIHELGADEAELTLPAILSRLSPVDLVVVEGFKRDPIPKIEVWREAAGHPLLAPEDPRIAAIATDRPLEGVALPQVGVDDIEAVADLVERLALPVAQVAA